MDICKAVNMPTQDPDLDVDFCFPQARSGYRKTSESTLYVTEKYNCIAWALGDTSQWWEAPVYGYLEPGQYWPQDAPRTHHPDSYRRMIELQGYEVCTDVTYDPRYEKVALYWGDGGPHAARQLETGKWTSKLGDRQDIEHDTLEALETDGILPAYGHVQYVLRRLRSDSS